MNRKRLRFILFNFILATALCLVNSLPSFASEIEKVLLRDVKEKFAPEYQEAISKTADQFLLKDAVRFFGKAEDPADWFVSILSKDELKIAIGFYHNSGIKKEKEFEELRKSGESTVGILGSISGKDGECTYDLIKKEVTRCYVWE